MQDEREAREVPQDLDSGIAQRLHGGADQDEEVAREHLDQQNERDREG